MLLEKNGCNYSEPDAGRQIPYFVSEVYYIFLIDA